MLWVEAFDKKIHDYLPEVKVLCDEPMANHTSFRIGGPAKRMAFPTETEQVILLVSFAQELGITPLLVGNGTNLLVGDRGIDGLVINTKGMDKITLGENEGEIVAQAGASLTRTALFALENGLSGLEFAHGIPGSVGGGISMNAGAYGGEMKDVLVGAAILFPEEGVKYLTCEELHLSYRHTIINEHPDAVVLYGVFRLQRGDKAEIKAKMDELMVRRKSSQPLEYPSAGSFFKRPTGYFAGALIEQANCKGMTVGDAQVSEKHAGFLINTGHATCTDVLALMEAVQKKVYEMHGVSLEPEVKIIK